MCTSDALSPSSADVKSSQTHNMLSTHTNMNITHTQTHIHTLTSGLVEIFEDGFDRCSDQNHNDATQMHTHWTHTHTLLRLQQTEQQQ